MPTCKSCGRPIIWAVTEKGKAIPLDPAEVPNGNIRLSPPEGATPGLFKGEVQAIYVQADPVVRRFVSHFATCPNAASHRKGKE